MGVGTERHGILLLRDLEEDYKVLYENMQGCTMSRNALFENVIQHCLVSRTFKLHPRSPEAGVHSSPMDGRLRWKDINSTLIAK